jgi:hypothetical protein
MGGALAQICAVELSKYCHSVAAVTFGAPGVFTKRTLDKYKLPDHALVLNFIHPYDPVPFAAGVFGWSHIGYAFTLKDSINPRPWTSYNPEYHKREFYFKNLGVDLFDNWKSLDRSFKDRSYDLIDLSATKKNSVLDYENRSEAAEKKSE